MTIPTDTAIRNERCPEQVTVVCEDRLCFPKLSFARRAIFIYTYGKHTVLELVLQPGGGAPLHVHQREDEIMYILEGECTFGFAGQVCKAPAGSMVALPKGLPHLFRNEGQDPCRLLITAVPGGLDEYFSEIGTALAQNRPELIPEINLRYDIDFNPPTN